MGVLVSVGGTLLTLQQANRLAKAAAGKIEDYVVGGKPIGKGLELPDLPAPISPRTLQALRDDADPTKPYQKVGLNRPLSMVLEYAYLGELPDAAKWNPLARKGDVLITSSNRPFEKSPTEPARAIHFLEPRAKSFLGMKVGYGSAGTQLMYYSPAVVDVSIVATVEMAIDRDFDEALTTKMGAALGAAAALPVFAPAAPYLIGASIAVPLAGKFANLMMQPNMFFRCSEEINLDRAGVGLARAGAFVLYPGSVKKDFAGYDLDPRTSRLVKNGREYKGDLPYAVMTLDGTKRSQWENWEATAMAADMVQRFFKGEDTLTGVIDVVSAGLELYNDMAFQKRAAAKKKELARAKTDAQKKKLQAELDALTKNIRNETVRKTVGSK